MPLPDRWKSLGCPTGNLEDEAYAGVDEPLYLIHGRK
jgi:hypothetical protein